MLLNKLNNKYHVPKQDWILTDKNPLLREKCVEVDTLDENDWDYIEKMVCYIDACFNEQDKEYKIKAGIAIAAPQVGLSKRIIYVHFQDGEEYQYLLVNPKIVSYSITTAYIGNGEGCLSVVKKPNGLVERKYKIVVEAFDLIKGEPIKIVAKDLLSVCLQHEIDHLDGILFTDRIDKKNPNAPKQHQAIEI